MAVYLMRGLDPSRFKVAAVSLFGPRGNDLEGMLAQANIKVWYLRKRVGFDPRMYLRLHAPVRKFKPQLVHTHLSVLRYVFPLLWIQRIPTIHTVHNVAEGEVDRVGRGIHEVVFRHGATPVAIAEAVRDSMRKVHRLDDVPVIPNGVPVQAYRASDAIRERLRAREGVPSHVPVVVSVARLSPQKNPALLLEAFALDPVRSTQAQLWLVGEGSLREALERQSSQLGLNGWVKFLGAPS